MAEISQLSLEDQIKKVAIKAGAALVGITSKDRLLGNECSDPTYYLPSAESVIGFAVPLDKEIIRNYLKKTDVSAQREQSMHEGRLYHKLQDIGAALKEFLESEGYEAVNCKVNMDYRKYKRRRKDLETLKQLFELVQNEPDHPLVQALKSDKIKLVNPNLTPYISLRYVAVASGIGRLGWSGNLVTPEYGARVYLGAVVTNAKLKPDPYVQEVPCNRCKVCVSTCQGAFFDAKESQKVRIGDIEEEIGKKHVLAKCILSCGGLTGQSKYKTWSTWSPWRVDIPDNDAEAQKVLQQTFRDHILTGGAKAKNILRLTTDTHLGFGKEVKPVENFDVTCGVCQLICWETEEERRKNAQLLHSSGEVVLENGKKVIKK